MVKEKLDPEFNDSLDRFIQAAQTQKGPLNQMVPVKDYNGDLTSKQSGSLSSELVKKKGFEFKGELD